MKYIYIRVSTEEQNYGQQLNCIVNHFESIGENIDGIDRIFREKKSGKISYKERPQMKALTSVMQAGDIIYVADFSRLGRNMIDLLNFVKLCDDRGVTIITCKDGQRIEAGSMMGKCLIFAFGIAAEVQVQNISQNTKDGLAVARKNGKKIGREKGCDTSAATAQSAKVRSASAQKWREESPAYNAVKRWVCQGMKNDWILNEFNEHNRMEPDVYCTRRGMPLTMATLLQWRSMIRAEFFKPFKDKDAATETAGDENL